MIIDQIGPDPFVYSSTEEMTLCNGEVTNKTIRTIFLVGCLEYVFNALEIVSMHMSEGDAEIIESILTAIIEDDKKHAIALYEMLEEPKTLNPTSNVSQFFELLYPLMQIYGNELQTTSMTTIYMCQIWQKIGRLEGSLKIDLRGDGYRPPSEKLPIWS